MVVMVVIVVMVMMVIVHRCIFISSLVMSCLVLFVLGLDGWMDEYTYIHTYSSKVSRIRKLSLSLSPRIGSESHGMG